MPIRSFACEECEMEWDQLIGMNESVDTCPNCGTQKVKTQITAAPNLRMADEEWNPRDKKWETKKGMTDRHATQMDVGYKPIESSRIKEFDNVYPTAVYGEYEKSVSVIQKVDYDPKEIKKKTKEWIKKQEGKGATVSVKKK